MDALSEVDQIKGSGAQYSIWTNEDLSALPIDLMSTQMGPAYVELLTGTPVNPTKLSAPASKMGVLFAKSCQLTIC